MCRVLWSVVASVLVAGTVAAQVPIIRTLAGTGYGAFCGDGGPATSGCLRYPQGVAADAAGHVFIVDSANYRIRKVDLSGTITTVAGSGGYGFCGDGGPATSACMMPGAVAVDTLGNIFIADSPNHRIRKVDIAGTITTVVGSGPSWPEPGSFCGDGGPATSACLRYPTDVAVDAAGNLFIADLNNFRIRKVDAAGIITTVAGNGTLGYCGDGGSATAACLSHPGGVAVDAAGTLFIADTDNSRIRAVDAEGTITTVAGNGAPDFCGDGGPATSACLNVPQGLAVDASGNLFIADSTNNRIRKLDATTGIITTVAGTGPSGYGAGSFCGDGGPATSACLRDPTDVAVDAADDLFIADRMNSRIRKVEAHPYDLASLRLSRTSLAGCLKLTAWVTLAEPATFGFFVSLHSDNPHVIVPASVPFKAGVVKKSVSILTSPVAVRETATIRASVPTGQVISALLTLKPMAPKAVLLSPNRVTGGSSTLGTVTLECPAGPGDIVVALTSSKPTVAVPVTTSIRVPVGTKVMPFEVTTSPVAAVTKPVIKAAANGVTKSKALVVDPAP